MNTKAKALIFAILTLIAMPIVFMIIGYIVVNFLAPLFLFLACAIFVTLFYCMWLDYFENRERFKIKKFE